MNQSDPSSPDDAAGSNDRTGGDDPWRAAASRFDEFAEMEASERRRRLGELRSERPELADLLTGLLAADGEVGADFLEQPAIEIAGDLFEDASSEALVGQRVLDRYVVERRLGQGGMGAVYLAHDSNLQRRVALKRVRVDGAASQAHRDVALRRLEREARAAAALQHPAVVQVFDFAREDDDAAEAWIVMEWVDGRPLSELTPEHGMAVGEVLPLALDVAEGLAAAHDLGLVHRDLKCENVVVTRDGRAKILDFGLARQQEPTREQSSSTTGDLPLTAAHQILGTLRCMSPEQARGEVVDGRSDLFSFGVLLYEVLCGVSPFHAAGSAATLTRVCTHSPDPAATVRPSVSQALSQLVSDLLEKDPAKRPQSADEVVERLAAQFDHRSALRRSRPSRTDEESDRESASNALFGAARSRGLTGAALVLAVLAVFVVLALAILSGRVELPSPGVEAELLRLGIVVPQVSGLESSEASLLAGALTTLVQSETIGREGVIVSSIEPMPADSDRRSWFADVQSREAVDQLLRVRQECVSSRCQLTLERLGLPDGRVLWAGGGATDPEDLALLSTVVSTQLDAAFSERPGVGQSASVLSKARLEEFVRLRRLIDERAVDREVVRRVQDLRRSTPGFVDAVLLETDAARQLFALSRRPEDLASAQGALAEARRLAPDDPRLLYESFDLNVTSNDWSGAEADLREIESRLAGRPDTLERRARLAAHAGDAGKALALRRQAARLQPTSARLFNLSLAEYRAGEVAAARRTLERLLERVPSSTAARSLLAQFELIDGDLERAVELYRQVLLEAPSAGDRSNLGLAYQLLGQFESSLGQLELAFEEEPANAAFTLSYADALWLAGETRRAEDLYHETIRLCSETDAASEPWQCATWTAQAFAHLGRRLDAGRAVRQALALAPEHPQVAFEASVVFAVLGETTSALVQLERAIDGGFDARWFTLPWFDDMRHPIDRLLDGETP